MALNYIWLFLFLVGAAVGVCRLIFFGDVDTLPSMMDATFEMSTMAFEMTLGLTGTLTLWMGLLKVAEDSGIVGSMAKGLTPVLTRLFPDIPKGHPALGSIFMNVAANMLGLDNAATPCGLKAMKELQEINPQKDTASNPMIMFLTLNTSGLTIIPVSIMAYRAKAGAFDPSDVFLPLLLTTMCSTLMGLICVALYQRINLFQKPLLALFGGLGLFAGGTIWAVSSMPPEQVQVFCRVSTSILLMGIICSFLIIGWRKKMNVYNSFITGAKDGFQVAVDLIPYVVAILAAIGVFKASGTLDMIQNGVVWCVEQIGLNTDWVGALPVALLKPLNGSGARGMMLEAFNSYGVDSFVGHLASVLQGSTDTTFYILAIYFGSVGIKKYRYSVTCGLLADLGGMIAAVFICYLFFG